VARRSDHRWLVLSRHVVRIARLFQQPEVIQGADRVGYDSQRSRIVFPRFTIEDGGKVNRLRYPLFPEPVPAAELEEPEAISPEELTRPARLCGQGGAEVFWAMTACVLANLLAPVYNRRTHGIALHGYVATTVGEPVARAFGCVEFMPSTVAKIREALQAEHRHDLPMLFKEWPGLPRRYRRQLFEPGETGQPRNCIVSVDFVAAKLLAINGGWHTIDTQHEGGIAADTLAVAKLLIPAYLKDLSERHFDLGSYPESSSSLVNLIVQDLARFVKARFGDEEDVVSAGRVMVTDDAVNRAEALTDLLMHFVENGRLEIKQTVTGRSKPTLLEVEHDGTPGLLIPYTTLERLSAQSSVPTPSLEQLYRVLEEANVLLDEDEDGPVCRREWFDKRSRVSRVKNSGLLKIHG
jgi:hypothetical protein